ncbi:MAG: pseudouridine synthase [Xanthobacteraceae bacterium]|nr:pseudouridine synthase [Xanthobacteraceae bacterium]
MPRDNDKNNASPRGRRDRQAGGRGRPAGEGRPAAKGRSGAKRGPEKKFAKRAGGGKPDGERRAYAGKPGGGKSFGDKSFGDKPFGKKPYAGKRDGDAPRRFRDDARPARFNREERPARGGDRPERAPRKDFRPRDDRGSEKRPYTPRGEGFRKDGPRKDFGSRDGERKFDRPREGLRRDDDRPKFSRGPRKDFGEGRDRGDAKPWEKRERGEGRQRTFDKPRFDRPRDDRGGERRPRFDRPRQDREERAERPSFRRPREDREAPSRERFADRPRRDNEDDGKVFAKRPAFGGRGAYRERKPDDKRKSPPPQPRENKSGERIAKLMARAGLASRRDAEAWVTQGRVTVNGRVINSPALDITANDVVLVDGKPLPERERTRLFLYHKPRGLMTTHADPEGRPTVFEHLPEGLPRLISVGRLDFNTEGLLLLTNDGGLARVLELPDTGWLRRYRARAHGEITQGQLDALRDGIEVDGVKYGSVEATLERDQGSNVWITIAIREGKNREVRNILAALGLEVNRLIRVSYGPFQLGEIAEGEVEEVRARVLREQLGEKVAKKAGAEFEPPARPDKAARPKTSVVEDRKGRTVKVQRTGSDAARARNDAIARGGATRPKRGYHGKRDLTPRD